MIRPSLRSPHFPYTPLFRSVVRPRRPSCSRCWCPAPSSPGATGSSASSAPDPVAPGEDGAGHQHRSEEHTSELQSRGHLVCRLLLEKKKIKIEILVMINTDM